LKAICKIQIRIIMISQTQKGTVAFLIWIGAPFNRIGTYLKGVFGKYVKTLYFEHVYFLYNLKKTESHVLRCCSSLFINMTWLFYFFILTLLAGLWREIAPVIALLKVCNIWVVHLNIKSWFFKTIRYIYLVLEFFFSLSLSLGPEIRQ
jgi:hypothetical protein